MGVIMMPVDKITQSITLPPGSRLAGIRFHPASGYGVMGRHYNRPLLMPADELKHSSLQQVFNDLKVQESSDSQLITYKAVVRATY